MTDLQMWDLIWGFISATFLIPIIQQPKWSTQIRAAVTFAFCVVSGLVIAALNGAYDGVHDIRSGMSSVLLTLASAIAFYEGFGKPTKLAPKLEAATSPKPPT